MGAVLGKPAPGWYVVVLVYIFTIDTTSAVLLLTKIRAAVEAPNKADHDKGADEAVLQYMINKRAEVLRTRTMLELRHVWTTQKYSDKMYKALEAYITEEHEDPWVQRRAHGEWFDKRFQESLNLVNKWYTDLEKRNLKKPLIDAFCDAASPARQLLTKPPSGASDAAGEGYIFDKVGLCDVEVDSRPSDVFPQFGLALGVDALLEWLAGYIVMPVKSFTDVDDKNRDPSAPSFCYWLYDVRTDTNPESPRVQAALAMEYAFLFLKLTGSSHLFTHEHDGKQLQLLQTLFLPSQFSTEVEDLVFEWDKDLPEVAGVPDHGFIMHRSSFIPLQLLFESVLRLYDPASRTFGQRLGLNMLSQLLPEVNEQDDAGSRSSLAPLIGPINMSMSKSGRLSDFSLFYRKISAGTLLSLVQSSFLGTPGDDEGAGARNTGAVVLESKKHDSYAYMAKGALDVAALYKTRLPTTTAHFGYILILTPYVIKGAPSKSEAVKLMVTGTTAPPNVLEDGGKLPEHGNFFTTPLTPVIGVSGAQSEKEWVTLFGSGTLSIQDVFLFSRLGHWKKTLQEQVRATTTRTPQTNYKDSADFKAFSTDLMASLSDAAGMNYKNKKFRADGKGDVDEYFGLPDSLHMILKHIWGSSYSANMPEAIVVGKLIQTPLNAA
ncbi:unnamed protein product [Amoebophrya sp. A25]|nr:unnamed protein product [Amoebophrya sp. A25]|eukprot:GSA25T00014963001.1